MLNFKRAQVYRQPAVVGALNLVRIFILLHLFLIAHFAYAAQPDWIAGTGDWAVGANWSGGIAPQAGDTAFIYNGGTAEITTPGQAATTTSLGVVSIGSSGTLTVASGGNLALSNQLLLAGTLGSSASVTITDANSQIAVGNTLAVGTGGTGNLTITNGGALNVTPFTGSTLTGTAPSGAANILIDGANATFNSANATFSQLGTSTITAQNQGSLISDGVLLALFSGSSTTVNIQSGGTWSINGASANIGSAGSAVVNIEDGGIVQGGFFPPNWSLGSETGSSGIVNIDASTGSSASSLTTGNMVVGNNGYGQLNITNGAVVNTSSAQIGNNTLSTASSALVDGVGGPTGLIPATWNSGALVVGNQGNGILNILDGGVVNSGNVTLAALPGSVAQANVQYAGSTWNTNNLTVGAYGLAQLSVLSGGSLNSTGTTTIGSNSGSFGSSILFNDSTWSAGNIIVGGGDLAQLLIQSGSQVTSGPVTIANTPGAGASAAILDNSNWSAPTFTVGCITGTGQGVGSLTVQGGATLSTNAVNLFYGPADALVLTGNSLIQTNTLSGGGAFALATFNQGTLRAAGNQPSFVFGFSNGWLQIQSGGLAIDSNGFDVGVDSSFEGVGGLTKEGAGVLRFNVPQGYTGDTRITQGTLLAGNTNVFSAASSHTVNPAATLALEGYSQTVRDLANNGLVSLAGLVPGTILTTAGNLSGAGTFALLTNLGALQGDLVIVQGTSAGNHILTVSNQGGVPSGPGQALEVVETTDGVAQFTLAQGQIDVGMYTYTLQKGLAGVTGPVGPLTHSTSDDVTAAASSTDNNWYLVNLTNTPSGQANAIIASSPGILESQWSAQVDTLLKRMGDLRSNPTCGNRLDVWIRNYDQRLNVDDSIIGTTFHQYLYGLDFGIDKAWQQTKYGQWFTGAFIGCGKAKQIYVVPYDADSGSLYAGIYGTWLDRRNGWYLDAVAKAQRFKNNLGDRNTEGVYSQSNYQNNGLTASLEAGKRCRLNQNWYLEPEIQALYTRLSPTNYTTDDGVGVAINSVDIFQARGTLVLGCTLKSRCHESFEPYVKAGVFDQTSNGGVIRAQESQWRPNLDGARAEAGAGVVYQFDRNVQLHLDYQASFGAPDYTVPWGINAGLRWVA